MSAVIAKRTTAMIQGSATARTFKLERLEIPDGVPGGVQLYFVQDAISTLLNTLSIGQLSCEITLELSATTKQSENPILFVTPPKKNEPESPSITDPSLSDWSLSAERAKRDLSGL